MTTGASSLPPGTSRFDLAWEGQPFRAGPLGELYVLAMWRHGLKTITSAGTIRDVRLPNAPEGATRGFLDVAYPRVACIEDNELVIYDFREGSRHVLARPTEDIKIQKAVLRNNGVLWSEGQRFKPSTWRWSAYPGAKQVPPAPSGSDRFFWVEEQRTEEVVEELSMGQVTGRVARILDWRWILRCFDPSREERSVVNLLDVNHPIKLLGWNSRGIWAVFASSTFEFKSSYQLVHIDPGTGTIRPFANLPRVDELAVSERMAYVSMPAWFQFEANPSRLLEIDLQTGEVRELAVISEGSIENLVLAIDALWFSVRFPSPQRLPVTEGTSALFRIPLMS